MVQGSSSTSELERGIENIGKRTYIYQSYKAEEISVSIKDEVDELPDEDETPIPSQDVGGMHSSRPKLLAYDRIHSFQEMPVCTEVQMAASVPISDTQLSNQIVASASALTFANESRVCLRFRFSIRHRFSESLIFL